MQHMVCTNEDCRAEDEVVQITGHLKPCDRVLCGECGQPMQKWEGDWRELQTEPFRSPGRSA